MGDSVVEAIKARLDIVQVVGQHGVNLKKQGRIFTACCPFHSEKTPSFVVYPESQTWYCFGQCGDGGDIFSFVMARQHLDFKDALKLLADQASVTLEVRQSNDWTGLRTALDTATAYYQRCLPPSPAAPVTVARGLTPDTVALWGLGYAPAAPQGVLSALDKAGVKRQDALLASVLVERDTTQGKQHTPMMRHRLVIPIRDDRGRVVALAGRALADDQHPKYLNTRESPLFKKANVLFGLDQAKATIRESKTAILVEGYFDVIALHQAGITNALAAMGTALTEQHTALLHRYGATRVVLAMDGDKAGRAATAKGLMRWLTDSGSGVAAAVMNGLTIQVAHLPEGHDPDTLIRTDRAAWDSCIAEAQDYADFLIDYHAPPPVTPLLQRERAARDLLPVLVTRNHALRDSSVLQMLAVRFDLPLAHVLAWQNTSPTPAPVTPVTQPQSQGADAGLRWVVTLAHHTAWWRRFHGLLHSQHMTFDPHWLQSTPAACVYALLAEAYAQEANEMGLPAGWLEGQLDFSLDGLALYGDERACWEVIARLIDTSLRQTALIAQHLPQAAIPLPTLIGLRRGMAYIERCF